MRFLNLARMLLALMITRVAITEKTTEIPQQSSEPIPLSNDVKGLSSNIFLFVLHLASCRK